MTAQTEQTRTMALPTLNPTAWRWRLARAAFRLGARLSDGLALGYRHGFDSGPMLDYVYRDTAQGRLLIGKMIDRIYLNQIGWRAIRARRVLLAETIRRLITARRAKHQPTHIVDIAAGPGRYLLELLAAEDRGDLSALCRDLDPVGQEQGRALVSALGLKRVTFTPGDATDPSDLVRITPAPQIVIASGIYEIITDDAAVRRSMRGVRALLAGGGTFIFTTQIAHPQLDLIANTLPNRNGEPWVMGVRPAATVEAWARAAGFTEIQTTHERNGLFAVTTAVARA